MNHQTFMNKKLPPCETILCTLEVDGCTCPDVVEQQLVEKLEVFVRTQAHPQFVSHGWKFFESASGVASAEEVLNNLTVLVRRATEEANSNGVGFQDRCRFFVRVQKKSLTTGVVWRGFIQLYQKRF